VLESGTSSYIL